MEKTLAGHRKPKFRTSVRTVVGTTEAEIHCGTRQCSFEFSDLQAPAVARLLADLKTGNLTPAGLASRSPDIAEQIPKLLEDFDDLRLLIESDTELADGASSGIQLFREVRRIADRTAARVAISEFFRALVEGRATRQQLIGYALEYYWIVQAAPGLIGPALGAAHGAAERALLQDFLRSELGHDRLLARSLKSVGVTQEELDAHQPLAATFALGASLGVYARQHPLSFKACLFLFERAQPDFVDAFDIRCRDLALPEAFYSPLRVHADLNGEYAHEDVSRLLMELELAVDSESCSIVKRHVSLMVETLVQQERQILAYYGQDLERIPRIFD